MTIRNTTLDYPYIINGVRMKKLVLSILLFTMTGFAYGMAPDLRNKLINTALHKYLEAYRPLTREQARTALHNIARAPFSSQQNINQTRPSLAGKTHF
jgi:hypothetical protein